MFVFAGTAAFVLDSAVLQILVREAHMEVHLARAISFVLSMTVTWQINRRFSFHGGEYEHSLFQEWLRYFASSLFGGAVNYGAFSIAIAVSPFVREHLFLGVAAGSLSGMVVNYLLYSRYVFGSPRRKDDLPARR